MDFALPSPMFEAVEGESMSNVNLVLRAAAFAADRHRNQRRKDAEASPYINHPLAVAAILADEAGVTDATVLCAALLHDTVEDTQTSIDEIAERFGPEIAAVVAEVTDDKSLPPAERKRLQVEKAHAKSDAAKLVKIADKTANLRDMASTPPADWPRERLAEYFDWARTVVDRLQIGNPALRSAFDEAYAARPAA
jgi:guanosine-3',5'-bis(diphosphate) 3'-pyrophosphohydrolase